jgi:tetratricopeptide (TPR) repeat protein
MNTIDYEINKELGECYLFMGELERARDYYLKAVNCNGTVAEPYLGLAAVALSEGSIDAAYKFYSKAHAVDSGPKPLTGMAMVEVELGKHSEAFTHYGEALTQDPGNMLVINNMLQLAHSMNRLDELLPFLEGSLEVGDTEVIRYALAACLTNLGREEEAKEHLELLLNENPGNPEAQQLYAQFAA